MMIENETAAYLREQDELAREVEEYRRINASLKKKIHARDKKITYLFACIDQMSKSSVPNQQSPNAHLQKNHSEIEHLQLKKYDVNFTDVKKKEKQNLASNQQNLFRSRELQSQNRFGKDGLKLPTLDRKNNLFEEQSQEMTNSRPKVIKVSIEKLIPLKPQDVKKKFQNKYK